MEVVSGAVQIGRHGGDPRQAVLAADRLDLHDAGDLRYRVRVVGRLQRSGEQTVFADGLWREFGVDAAGPQEQQTWHALGQGGVHQVDLDPQVLAEELDGIRVVRDNPTDPR